MKEVNLADYIKGSDPVQNRIDFWLALAAVKNQRAHYLYVPDPNPGVVYQMKLLAADKMTDAQSDGPNAEPGDRAIARFLIDWDLEIYGDGWDHSVLSVGTDVAGMQFAGLKPVFPFSLTLRGVRLTSMTPMVDGTSPMTYGLYVPPKAGNPAGENRLRVEKSKIDWFGDTVAAPSGPVNAVNHTAIELFDSEIRGQKLTVAVWNDPDDDGTKTLHMERCKLYNTNKHSGWGSHLMYLHENVSWKTVSSQFYEWATGKFAIQNWGSDPNGHAKFSEALDCYWDKSGEGPAIITSNTGPCQVKGGRMECRQGIEARQKLMVSDLTFKPTPSIVGTVACLSTYDNAEVVARNIICDMSEVGDNQATVFAITNNNSIWDIDGARIDAKKRTASLAIYGTAANTVHGLAKVKSRNVVANGYHVPDVDYAAGIRSTMCAFAVKQATWDIADQFFQGDMVSDRGALRFDGPTNVLESFTGENIEVIAQRGLGMYSDLSTSGKVHLRRTKMHNARMVLIGGAYQLCRFDEATAPLPVVPVTTRKSSDWVAYHVLPIGTDYDTVLMTGNPADPIVDVLDICVNLIRKTMIKPAQPPQPAVTYTDVYSSEDTDNFVGAPLRVQSTVNWLWRGLPVSAGKVLTLQRVYGNWTLS